MKRWMKKLAEDNTYFSELVHAYYKLASMRVMQELREKYGIPQEDLPTLYCAIFARMLNEAVYSLGAQIKNGSSIRDIYSKEQLLNLVRVLNNEELDVHSRDDIETDIKKSLDKFKQFIVENASTFYKE